MRSTCRETQLLRRRRKGKTHYIESKTRQKAIEAGCPAVHNPQKEKIEYIQRLSNRDCVRCANCMSDPMAIPEMLTQLCYLFKIFNFTDGTKWWLRSTNEKCSKGYAMQCDPANVSFERSHVFEHSASTRQDRGFPFRHYIGRHRSSQDGVSIEKITMNEVSWITLQITFRLPGLNNNAMLML